MRNLLTGGWYTIKNLKETNQVIITGYDPTQEVAVGSKLMLFTEPPTTYEITSVVHRNHKGIFVEPKNAINSYYSATETLIIE